MSLFFNIKNKKGQVCPPTRGGQNKNTNQMVILKQEGIAWSILNIVLVAAVLYFSFLALNRWVVPFNAPAN